MILFFDTETSGPPDFNKRASDPSQPHIVQLAAIMTDMEGKEVEVHNVITKPDGWEIPAEATAIHGISTDYAIMVGIPESVVASLLFSMCQRAVLTVAHNHQFDKFIARIAARRYGLLTDELDPWWKALPTFCTMREMTEVCDIPGKYGKCKWPTMQEAHQHAFGKPFEGAHDAMADVRACKEVYFWLKRQGKEVAV